LKSIQKVFQKEFQKENMPSSPVFHINKNMSLYIPYVESHISPDFIIEYFSKYDIGIVKRVDLISKINKQGIYYHGAFIHFEYWFQSTLTKNIQNRLKNKELVTRLVYDEPKYWIVQENTSAVFSLVEEEEKVLGSGYVTGKKNHQINVDGLKGFKRVVEDNLDNFLKTNEFTREVKGSLIIYKTKK
jgi:hypothetical protein